MRKSFRKILPELFVACAILLGLWKIGELWRERSEAVTSAGYDVQVHFLDVGQGMATLVAADGRYMLVDGGGWESAPNLLDYLETVGVDRLEYLVISHYDVDHLYGAVRVLETYEVGQVLCPDYGAESDTYRRFLAVTGELAMKRKESGALEASGDQGAAQEDIVSHPAAGETFSLGDCSFTVVSPARLDYPEENNRSLGIRLVCGDISFLMMGDAELESEYDVCDSGLELRSTVYLVNHHGSSSSTSQQLLKYVRPKYAVISCGENNEYGHPAKSVLQRLEEFGVEVFRTDQQGTVVAHTDGRELEWSAEEKRGLTLQRKKECGIITKKCVLPAYAKCRQCDNHSGGYRL